MIYIGKASADKPQIVRDYVKANGIESVKVLCPTKFAFPGDPGWEFIDWPEIIMYRTFYRLLQEVGPNTLVVVNECLRTQNRSDLTLNCIRHFLSQTRHQIVFQWLPIIESVDDFMILLDFDTQSKFKGRGWSAELREFVRVDVMDRSPTFVSESVDVSGRTVAAYAKERDKLFAGIGAKDPHTIPRQLHLVAGKEKALAVGDRPLVGRNNRFGLDDLIGYKDNAIIGPRTVFESCHNLIDMADFVCLAEQVTVPFVTTELKVDQWYFDRAFAWGERVRNAIAEIS